MLRAGLWTLRKVSHTTLASYLAFEELCATLNLHAYDKPLLCTCLIPYSNSSVRLQTCMTRETPPPPPGRHQASSQNLPSPSSASTAAQMAFCASRILRSKRPRILATA